MNVVSIHVCSMKKKYSKKDYCIYVNSFSYASLFCPIKVIPLLIRNMYKGSEPMGRLHSVQKHMANVYLPLQFKEVKM